MSNRKQKKDSLPLALSRIFSKIDKKKILRYLDMVVIVIAITIIIIGAGFGRSLLVLSLFIVILVVSYLGPHNSNSKYHQSLRFISRVVSLCLLFALVCTTVFYFLIFAIK
jgi:hypothetical protein